MRPPVSSTFFSADGTATILSVVLSGAACCLSLAVLATVPSSNQQRKLGEPPAVVSTVHNDVNPAPMPLKLGTPTPIRVASQDSLVLQYHLGAEGSLLQATTDTGRQTFDLPPRAEIENLVTLSYPLLQSAGRINEPKTDLLLSRLGDILLSPVAAELGRRRHLTIIPDGKLWQLPFGALPLPAVHLPARSVGPQRLLIDDHVITLTIRAEDGARMAKLREDTAPPRRLALFADPVYSTTDARMSLVPPTASSQRISESAPQRGDVVSGPSLARLPFTSVEASLIRRLVPGRETLIATGFDATRERVLSGELKDYRILHFATHGISSSGGLNATGLMLSTVDRFGLPTEGAVWAHEIRQLSLPVDLVVLSSCETGLGEGIEGRSETLARAFLDAGADQVITSLWQVNDRATAELMSRFYRFLLEDGLTAAAALQQAQRSMRDEPPWRSSYFWAGFVIQEGPIGPRI